MIGMKPKDAVELKEDPLVNRESYPTEDTLPEDGFYHYLLQPRAEHDDQRKRATDRIWSKKTYRYYQHNRGGPWQLGDVLPLRWI